MDTIQFNLTQHIYAAYFDNCIIILDSARDKYVSLIDAAARYFQFIISGSLKQNQQGHYAPLDGTENIDIEQLNYWIVHFLEKQFIVKSFEKKTKCIAPQPLQSGGLSNYRWDNKPSWQPFAKTQKLEIIKAFFVLAKVHRTMKRNGINGILELIRKTTAAHHNPYQPSEQELNILSDTIDAASVLYPKKTYCLAWAATFVLIALKKNWKCNVAIGVQMNPFYAHAWVVSADKVIHDDPVIARVLSIILNEPEN